MSVCFCVRACVCVCWWKKIWHTRRNIFEHATHTTPNSCDSMLIEPLYMCVCVCLCAWFDAFVYGDLYEYGMEYETIRNRRLHIKALLVSDTRMFFFYPFAYDLHIIKPSKWVTTTRQERKKKKWDKVWMYVSYHYYYYNIIFDDFSASSSYREFYLVT